MNFSVYLPKEHPSNTTSPFLEIEDIVGVNGTATTGVFPEQPLPAQWLFLCLAIIPACVIFGNFLVLMAVICQRSLRTLSNYVIASLAFTDLMVALVVVPFGIYQIVSIKHFFLLLSLFIINIFSDSVFMLFISLLCINIS